MSARAVNDLVTEPIMNGVCGVTGRPEGSAIPKPLRWTIWSPWTMPSRPGFRRHRRLRRHADAQLAHLRVDVGVDGGEIRAGWGGWGGRSPGGSGRQTDRQGEDCQRDPAPKLIDVCVGIHSDVLLSIT